MRIRNTFIAICMVLSGCASLGANTKHYIKPSGFSGSTAYEETISEPFDDVWGRLKSNMYRGFFEVRHADLKSGEIELTFKSNSPQKYIDCGRMEKYFSFNGEKEHYSYEIASDTAFKYADTWGAHTKPAVIAVTHTTWLDGRANVRLSPSKENQTRVIISVRYAFHEKVDGVANLFNASDKLVGTKKLQPKHYNVSFSTGHSVTKNGGVAGKSFFVTCWPKGTLETMIMDLAKH